MCRFCFRQITTEEQASLFPTEAHGIAPFLTEGDNHKIYLHFLQLNFSIGD